MTYLLKYREYNQLNISSKQMNYPTKQKNFSNFLEPKLFLRRDFNFYNKEFFSISHEYIKNHLIKENDKINLVFYPHHYYSQKMFQNNNNLFECEIITTQNLYLGRVSLQKIFICFETREEEERKNKKFDIDYYSKYAFSIK